MKRQWTKLELSIENIISKEEVLKVYELLKKNQYGQYLMDVLNGKYLDARR